MVSLPSSLDVKEEKIDMLMQQLASERRWCWADRAVAFVCGLGCGVALMGGIVLGL